MAKYKIGWYVDDLEEKFDPYNEIDDEYEFVQDVATQFAENNHQIDEDSDMEFSVFVEVNGEITEVKFRTEFDPVYYVDEVI